MSGYGRNGKNSLGYLGVQATTPPQMLVMDRAPTSTDVIGYTLGTQWLYKIDNDPTNSIQYVLTSVQQHVATWVPLNVADNIELPDHSVALGTGTSGLNSVGPGNIGELLMAQGTGADPVFGLTPSPTIGQPIVSTGPGAEPEYGTATVSGGGTGVDVLDQYAVLCGGIAGDAPVQQVVGLGTATQVLTSNGLGNLPTWENPTGGTGGNGGPIKVQVFNVAGAHVYTPTATAASCFVECIGGGAGGQSVDTTAANPLAGSGGGAGAYSRKFFLISALGATEDLVVGAGGATDATGGDTTFGTAILMTAGGGDPAVGDIDPGLGGVAVGGDINLDGGAGGVSIESSATAIFSGFGGSNLYGAGGAGAGPTSAVGNDGQSFGGGGSGGIELLGAAQKDGGAGADGIIVITEFGPYAPTPPADPVNINVIVFDTPGAATYTPTAGMFQCIVECLGGGGSGHGEPTTSSPNGGGGAGGYCKQIFDDVTIGVSQAIVVGAGGVGGTPGSVLGTNGGNTTFGALMTAGGGSRNSNGTGNGGAGGTAVGGFINVPGQAGSSAIGGLTTAGFKAGDGGSTIYGAGGVGPSQWGATTVAANGTGYGSGASGFLTGAPAGSSGGNGAAGVVIVTEYIGA